MTDKYEYNYVFIDKKQFKKYNDDDNIWCVEYCRTHGESEIVLKDDIFLPDDHIDGYYEITEQSTYYFVQVWTPFFE